MKKNEKKYVLNKNILVLFIIANIWGILYIAWRLFYTINYANDAYALTWSVLLLLAEAFSMMIFVSFSLAVIRKDEYKLPGAEYTMLMLDELPYVDIFVCSLNEDEEILKPTLTSALNIDYPNKKVYLLDDGRRPEMFELTKKLGCHYITRNTNIGFKAGNINNALRQTDGEVILVLDADHVPVATLLKEIINNFKDEKVALVQTPQHFFNLDPFQKNLSFEKHLTNEQDLFYRVIEPGLSVWNATICGGTNFLIRRKHLAEVGGFPEDTITEDFAVSLKLESKHYKILYYNKPLCSGKSTETFQEYVKQRSRWARGNLGVIYNFSNLKYLFKLNPIQIFLKIAGVTYFFYPFARLIFIFSPIAFIFFDLISVVAIVYQLIIFQITYFIFKIWFFVIIAKKYRNFLFTDVYECATSPFLAIELIKFILIPPFIKKPKFIVSNKSSMSEKSSIDFQYFIPLLLITFILFAGEVKAIWDLHHDPVSPGGIAVNIFWNTYNLLIMFYALRATFDRPEFRKNIRIPVRHEVIIINKNRKQYSACTINISQGGALLSSKNLIPNEFLADAHIKFSDCEEMKIDHIQTIATKNDFLYRIKFNLLKEEDAFLKNMFLNSNSWDRY
ncbi:MAG TPA: cellulose synthase catalytic subunit [Candidatus Gastranaerophilales bacterium]|nr:cellulose synthase catalytic subunit [Candidatus Gastranaerophilales bacterium]